MPLGKPLLHVLDRMGYGGLILGTAGQVLRINDTAQHLLREHASAGRHVPNPDWSHALKVLLGAGGAARFRMDADDWAVVQPEAGQGRPLILRAVPITERATSGPQTVLILVNLEAVPQPTTETLQRIFGLTPAEARLAIEIALGKSPEEIAQATHVTVGTVRNQLHAVFAKTGTHRQGELVALLARVAILP